MMSERDEKYWSKTMVKKISFFLFLGFSCLSYAADDQSPYSEFSHESLKSSTSSLSREMDTDSVPRRRLSTVPPSKPLSSLNREGSRKSVKSGLKIETTDYHVTLEGLVKRVEDLEGENTLLREQFTAMERNLAQYSGNDPVYYRIMRADMVLQLTVICTFVNFMYTLVSGQGGGAAFMTLIGAYSFYYFFKFVRDAGTVVGNVVAKRPNN
jgi:hypothetical protein